MLLRTRILLTFLVLFLFSLTEGIFMIQYFQDLAHKSRQINISGRQRMLSQKLSKECLLIVQGIDPEINRSNAMLSYGLFDRSLRDLVRGNPEAGIYPPSDPAIVTQLLLVSNLWRELSPAIMDIVSVDGAKSSENIQSLYLSNTILLREMDKAVGMYEKAGDIGGVVGIKIVFLVLSGLFIFVFLYLIRKWAITPLVRMGLEMRKLREGNSDLTHRLPVAHRDEIGELTESFNAFIDNLDRDISALKDGAKELEKTMEDTLRKLDTEVGKKIDQIGSLMATLQDTSISATAGVEELGVTFEEIATNIEGINAIVSRQVSAVEESSSSIEEMSRSIENTSLIASRNVAISEELSMTAKEGDAFVQSVLESVKKVSELSQQIQNITSIISGVADQTGMLSMNAAIEAAHAGDAGKGFSIVAQEIRTLSNESNRNANEIQKAIRDITAQIALSVKNSGKAGEVLRSILEKAENNRDSSRQLDIMMKEQSDGGREILLATQSLVGVAEELKGYSRDHYASLDSVMDDVRNIQDKSMRNIIAMNQFTSIYDPLISAVNESMHKIARFRDQIDEMKRISSRFIVNTDGKLTNQG